MGSGAGDDSVSSCGGANTGKFDGVGAGVVVGVGLALRGGAGVGVDGAGAVYGVAVGTGTAELSMVNEFCVSAACIRCGSMIAMAITGTRRQQ